MTPTLSVVCVWVRGEYPYSVDYVSRLCAMTSRWIFEPFAFYCLTDRPEMLAKEAPGVIPVAVEKLAGFAPWTKLELFNPARAWQGRVLYLDLDSIVVGPLDGIIHFPASFAITSDPASFHKPRRVDAFGRAIVRRFNSSVMVWDGGLQTSLYSDWSPSVSRRLSGDQDWIGEHCPTAAALPRDWFPRISELGAAGPTRGAKVILAKRPKNDEAAILYPWVAEAWQ